MSDEEAPSGGEDSSGEVAAPVPDTTTGASVDTTTSGVQIMVHHPWLAAAAVAVYATKVMWVMFRELGLAKQEKLLPNKQDITANRIEDIEKSVLESESKFETDTESKDLSPSIQANAVDNI
ncbi:uncharacterized protein LOC108093620 [Drosophila ficusphila]|uniref:uncharacterized protein LOC108093620 n=1 Tax=Drosophila ficusphila TaxID=30025 RepID=UPI0007E6B395|nr:uncharacterized protein LOC108093620 [Drosophila ficusphila]